MATVDATALQHPAHATAPAPVPDKKIDDFERLKQDVSDAITKLTPEQARTQELAALEAWASSLRALVGEFKGMDIDGERAAREQRRIAELLSEIRALSESQELAGRKELRAFEMTYLNARLDAAKDTLTTFTPRKQSLLEIQSANLKNVISAYVLAEWRGRSSPEFPQPIGKTGHQSSSHPAWSKTLPFEWASAPADRAVLDLKLYDSHLMKDNLIGVGEWEIVEFQEADVLIVKKDAVKHAHEQEKKDGADVHKTMKYSDEDIVGTIRVRVVPAPKPKTFAATAEADVKSSRGCLASMRSDPDPVKVPAPHSPVKIETRETVKAEIPPAPGVVPVLTTPQSHQPSTSSNM